MRFKPTTSNGAKSKFNFIRKQFKCLIYLGTY